MFNKKDINIIYRILCLICYAVVILFVNSLTTLIALTIVYCFLGLYDNNFRNIEFIIITLFLLGIGYLFNYYLLFKIMLIIDYFIYFLNYIPVKSIKKLSKKEYIRFTKSKKNKKGSSNAIAVYLTVHLIVLFIAIMVG